MGSTSEEYLESVKAVASDPFDSGSWLVILDEVEKGRGGTATVTETFQKFLKHFPRSARAYSRLANYLVQNAQSQVAEELLSPQCEKLRNVDLWSLYFKIVKRLVPKDPKDEAFIDARKLYEGAFERALENVGYSTESGPLWKEYIEFLRDLPDATTDPTKKRESIRSAYQRALAVPNEHLDDLWRGYDQFERSLQGELSAKESLPDVEKKCLSAKALFRERKRMMGAIDLGRLAVPPSRSRQELEQLGLWNRWIRYEKSNPDNLSPEAFKSAMQMLYDQCLCCMRFHPEVWLSLAWFHASVGGGGVGARTSAIGGKPSGIVEARAVLNEAIETIPASALLRVSFSEIEEQHGSIDNARKILDVAFDHMPNGFVFAVRQRFIRRRDGLVAGRKCFSDTLSMRLDKKIGFETYMSHAQLELDVNCSPDVCVRVLELARATFPTEAGSSQFVRLMVRALLRLGDLAKIRWAFSTVLGEGGGAGALSIAAARVGVDGTGAAASSRAATADAGGNKDADNSDNSTGSASGLSLSEQCEMWEDYLSAETILGVSSVGRLDELRKHRDAARAAYEDTERSKHVVTGAAAIAAAEIAAAARAEGLFENSNELLERYVGGVGGGALGVALPDGDTALSDRCRTFAPRSSNWGVQQAGAWGGDGGAEGRRYRRWDSSSGGGADGSSSSASDIILGVTPQLRAFINKLPPFLASAPPDYDTFTRSLRSLVLPPRPLAEDEGLPIPGMAGKRGAEWLTNLGNEDDDAAGDDLFSATRDDIFRQRQRARLL